MASLSNTYTFGINTQIDDLFREAYERIGIVGNDQTPLNVESAIMSANLELSSWPGRGLNLWLIKREMFSIYPNQPIYNLPDKTVRVLEVTATQPVNLNTGGIPFTFGSIVAGDPANCFVPGNTTGCRISPTEEDGIFTSAIGYNYGNNNISILYVGFTPLVTDTYNLAVQYSFDGSEYITPYLAQRREYIGGQQVWFVVENAVSAPYWRIVDITNIEGKTFTIQQVNFCQPTNVGTGDRLLSSLSRSEYMAIATKMNTGFPSGYYFDQQIKPTIILWPVPAVGNGPTNILYTNYAYAQDITQMFQNAEVPQRFYDALVAGIASRLAMKFAPDKFQMMKAEAQEAYQIAAATDFENVTLRFDPDFTGYGG